jgi:hypothetical protein
MRASGFTTIEELAINTNGLKPMARKGASMEIVVPEITQGPLVFVAVPQADAVEVSIVVGSEITTGCVGAVSRQMFWNVPKHRPASTLLSGASSVV